MPTIQYNDNKVSPGQRSSVLAAHIQNSGALSSRFFHNKLRVCLKTPCDNWGLGTGVKNADSLVNAIPLSNIRSYASDSGVSSSTAPMKPWQAQLASTVKILDLQNSKQLCNASPCLPSLLIVLISPPRVAELPRVCTAPGHVPIYRALSRFYS